MRRKVRREDYGDPIQMLLCIKKCKNSYKIFPVEQLCAEKCHLLHKVHLQMQVCAIQGHLLHNFRYGDGEAGFGFRHSLPARRGIEAPPFPSRSPRGRFQKDMQNEGRAALLPLLFFMRFPPWKQASGRGNA